MSIEPGIGGLQPQQGAVPGSVVYKPVPAAVSNQVQYTGSVIGVSTDEFNKQAAMLGTSTQRQVYNYDSSGKLVAMDPTIVKNSFSNFNKNVQNMILSGMKAIGQKPTQASIETFLGNVMDASIAQNEMAGVARPWIEALDPFVNTYAQVRQQTGGGGGGGPTQAVSLTDPGTAKQLINQSLQQYLGRNATPDELQNFVAALNKAEMKSPRVSRVAGATAVTAGGFNPATFAEDYAAGMEGAGEFQAVTSALDNFIGSLANPVKVV